MRRSFPFEVFPWRFTLLLGPCLGPGESAILKGREGERSVEGERPRIIILDDEVVSRIAAGEVVERPASVVKELVENSLDAGATRVEVDVEEGGKRLIRVADDGCGMSEEEALLALQRHATSKIRSVEDLERIVTLGFRGEALPSIAAVSKMEVVTRRPEDEEGTMVLVEGGVVVDVRKVGCPPGTMVTVRHLFYNTPARLKFLKGAQTELAHISEWMIKFVLAWPEVSFRLRHKGQVLLSTRRGGTVYDAVAATLGMEALRNMVEIGAEGEGFTIRGLVSLPTLTRAAKSHQYLIVNKRAVKPSLLSRALQEAYRGLIPQGRHPVAVVWMEVEPHLVDVNVHPAKVEVKFRDEHKLLDALVKAVADSLRKGRALSKPEPERPKKEEPKPKPVLLQKPIPSFGEVVKQKAGIRVFPPALERLELRPPGPDVRDLLSVAEPLGQIGTEFVVAASEEGLILVDQHAAHERIVFERLLRAKADEASQRLLVPVELDLPPVEARTAEAHLDQFQELGFSIRQEGASRFVLEAVPTALKAEDPKKEFLDILDEISSSTGPAKPRLKTEEVAAIVACHSAVRAGKRLTHEEMRRLLQDLSETENPLTCPHGRPTLAVADMGSLRKLFRRE